MSSPVEVGTVNRSISLKPDDETRIRAIMQRERVNRTEAIRRAIESYETKFQWAQVRDDIIASISQISQAQPHTPKAIAKTDETLSFEERENLLIMAIGLTASAHRTLGFISLRLDLAIPHDAVIDQMNSDIPLTGQWKRIYHTLMALQRDPLEIDWFLVFAFLTEASALSRLPNEYQNNEHLKSVRVIFGMERVFYDVLYDLQKDGIDIETHYQTYLDALPENARELIPKSLIATS